MKFLGFCKMGKSLRKINQRKAGAVLSYLTMGVEYIVALIYTPALIAMLGQSEYGNYQYVMSVTNYLMILNSGFGTAYVRFYSRYKSNSAKTEKDIHSLNGMFLSIFLAMGMLVLLIGFAASNNADAIFGGSLSEAELQVAPTLVRILVLNIFVSFIDIVFKSFVITQEKFIFQKLLIFVQYLMRPLVILPLVYISRSSVGVAFGTLFISIVILLADCYYCVVKGKMRFSFKRFDFSLIKEIAVFCSFLLILLIVERINLSLGQLVLGKISGTIAVAIYAVAAELNIVYRQLATNIANVFVAKVNKMVAGNDSNKHISDLFIRIGRILFLILALISTGFAFFGRQFIHLWVGPEYNDAYWIALMLLFSATIPEIQIIGPEVLKAKNLHKFRSIVYFLIAIFNVILSIYLGKLFGGIGCAMGTAITVLLGQGLVINIYYHKKVKLDVIRFWKQIISMAKGLIIPIIFGIVVNYFITIKSWITLVLCCGAYALIYAASQWLFAMNAYEKDLILKAIKNRKKAE